MLGCGAAPEAGSWVLPGGKFDRLKPIERANHLVDQIESFRMGERTTSGKTISSMRFVMGSRFRWAIVKDFEDRDVSSQAGVNTFPACPAITVNPEI
jgi:hypothetical protein